MPILILVLLITNLYGAPRKEVALARQSIEALIRPLIQNKKSQKTIGHNKFRLDGCEKHKIDWTDVLLMRKEVVLSYSFGPKCDIQGQIRPVVLRPFETLLDLRNLEDFKKLRAMNKITSSIESKPVMLLELREGVLTGTKGAVKFEADYQVRMNPARPDSPLEENLGGELRIHEIYGQKVTIKEKIKVQ